jgi:hypothetical protein
VGFGSQRHSLPGPGMAPVATISNYPLVVTTNSLPGATVGTPYSATLTASGGLPPYTWSIISGSLPPGLSMDSSGNITGTPTTAGTYNFTAQVVDPIGNVGSISVGVAL